MKEKQGNLARIGMPKLLHLIYTKGDAASTLDIVREPIKKRFIFKDGLPVGASSNILNEVLGRLLMQEGIITQKDYERSLEVVLKDKKKHGQVLISMGLITPEQLSTFLTLQVKRRLFKIFGWNEGTYRYVKSPGAPSDMTPLELHPASLILEGISLGFYPNPRIKSDLKDYLDVPVTLTVEAGRYTLGDFHLNIQEKRFLESIDGKKTLREVLEASDLLKHRALSIALSLIITGVITGPDVVAEAAEAEVFEEGIKEPEAAEAPFDSKLNAEILFMKAKSSLEKKDYAGAVKTLTEITELNPREGEYWAYLGWAVYRENPENLKKAEKIIKDSIDLNNDLDIAWHFLGVLSLASGETDQAKRCFRTAVAKNPWMLKSVSELKRLEAKEAAEPPADFEERRKYVEAFGFDADPFAPAADPGYAYLTGSRIESLESLSKSIMKKSGPVLLTGVAGTGKTTLAIELLKRLSAEKVLPVVVLKPADNEIDLIKEINSEVGVTLESSSIKEQLLALGMKVSQNKIHGGHTVLIIDQAHQLTAGCLKLIQYLSRLKTLQIALFGEPSLAEKLKASEFAELDQKIASRIELRPLSIDETREYVVKRLKAAKKVFCTLTDEALVLLFEESGGVPSAINAKTALLLSEALKRDTCSLDNNIAMSAFGRKKVFETEEAAEVFVEKAFEEAEATEAQKPPPGPSPGTSIEATHARVPSAPPPRLRPEEKHAEPPPRAAPPHAQAPREAKEPKAVKNKGTSRLVIWVLVMLAAGLIAGILIGIYWQGSVKPPEAPAVKPTEKAPVTLTAPIEATTAIQGSVENAPLEGTNGR